MSRRIPVTQTCLCDHCKWRDDCNKKSAGVSSCGKVYTNSKEHFYKCDNEAKAMCAAVRFSEIEAYFARLERTERDQLDVTSENRVVYRAKPCSLRKANSRDNLTVTVGGSGLELYRWCENCGSEFETTNRDRRLCDACHDEICVYLGVDYSKIPDYKTGNVAPSRRDVE